MKPGTLVKFNGYRIAGIEQIWMIIERHESKYELKPLLPNYRYTILNLKTGIVQTTHWTNITKFETESRR